MAIKLIDCRFYLHQVHGMDRTHSVTLDVLDKHYPVDPYLTDSELDKELLSIATKEVLAMIHRGGPVLDSLTLGYAGSPTRTVRVIVFEPVNGYLLTDQPSSYTPDGLMQSLVATVGSYLYLNHNKSVKLLWNFSNPKPPSILYRSITKLENEGKLKFVAFLSPHMPIRGPYINGTPKINALYHVSDTNIYITLGRVFMDNTIPVLSIFGGDETQFKTAWQVVGEILGNLEDGEYYE